MAKGTKTLNSAIEVDNRGNVYLKVAASEPDDGDVADGEMVFWIDTGGPTLKVKANGDGAILNGDVADLS